MSAWNTWILKHMNILPLRDSLPIPRDLLSQVAPLAAHKAQVILEKGIFTWGTLPYPFTKRARPEEHAVSTLQIQERQCHSEQGSDG